MGAAPKPKRDLSGKREYFCVDRFATKPLFIIKILIANENILTEARAKKQRETKVRRVKSLTFSRPNRKPYFNPATREKFFLWPCVNCQEFFLQEEPVP